MAEDEQQKKERAQKEGGAPAQEEPPPFWEWVVAGVGLLLLLSMLGYLAYEALTGRHEAALPRAEVLEILPQDGRFLVRVRVHNAGDATAERVKLTGALRAGGSTVDESDTEFDFLPGRSSREGALLFSRDPRAAALELRARSWQKP